MAAIARFVSFDGGIAFSDSVLKIQKRDEERGRLIPIERIAGVEVAEPLLGDDGCIRVQIAGERTTTKNVVRFDEEQYDDALSFKCFSQHQSSKGRRESKRDISNRSSRAAQPDGPGANGGSNGGMRR